MLTGRVCSCDARAADIEESETPLSTNLVKTAPSPDGCPATG